MTGKISAKAVRPEALLRVEGLCKHFPLRGRAFGRQVVRAVDGVSFAIPRGSTLGLVGESGCGKTTVGRAVLRLVRPTAGTVVFEGTDLAPLAPPKLRALRRRMGIIFQDPYAALNPRMTVGAIVGEPLVIHRAARGAALRDRVVELLGKVHLGPDVFDRYPHEFSGGQRQRVGIARALALSPALVVCDEPTSALDVSIRAQIINLLDDLQRAEGIAYLLISHDLAAVGQLSHEVAVMYLGRIVEQAPAAELYAAPRHPYTRLLMSAVPVPDPARRPARTDAEDDEVPSPIDVPPGCAFHPRCPLYQQKGRPPECRRQTPPLVALPGNAAHRAACHFAAEPAASSPRKA